mmetsp:Transcript_1200/g.3721  ORF Transcript_1200/g.3721 Transcript_1200/m.3721 type:complete len:357 (+) Transcript_1200:88-1158(+)
MSPSERGRPEPPHPEPTPRVPGQPCPADSPQLQAMASNPPAGGPDETNQTSDSNQDMDNMGGENTSGDSSRRPSNYKTRLCIKFQQHGVCSFEDKCNFAHGSEELRTNHGGNSAGNNNAAPKVNPTTPRNRKTRLCTKWQTTGSCPYADRCNFAHGDQELQKAVGTPEEDVNYAYNHVNPMQKKSNYKTRICMNWQQNNGHCSYGARCNFAHGMEELRSSDKDGPYPGAMHFINPGMAGFGMMPFAQVQMPTMPGEMSFTAPMVQLGAGGMPFCAPTMPMEHFNQPGFVSQVPPFCINTVIGGMMHPPSIPSPGPIAVSADPNMPMKPPNAAPQQAQHSQPQQQAQPQPQVAGTQG